jgi:16S rRNA (uracil1498-N3)-methyltransferase
VAPACSTVSATRSSDEVGAAVSLRPYVHVEVDLTSASRGDLLPLTARDRHHLTRVLRLSDGAAVEVADGAGGSAAAALAGDGLRLVSDPVHVPRAVPLLTLAQGLPKARKLDAVIRVATELGVDRIVPVAADRSVVRLDGDRAAKAAERWHAVARAAAEQSRSPHLPEVGPLVATAELPRCVGLPSAGELAVAHPDGPPLPDVAAAWAARPSVTVAIGPEGGFSDDEVRSLLDDGGTLVGLGPTILRTEHAGAAALSVLAAMLGRWTAQPVRSARRTEHAP